MPPSPLCPVTLTLSKSASLSSRWVNLSKPSSGMAISRSSNCSFQLGSSPGPESLASSDLEDFFFRSLRSSAMKADNSICTCARFSSSFAFESVSSDTASSVSTQTPRALFVSRPMPLRARTYLKGMGLLTNSARGVWVLTDDAVSLLTDSKANEEEKRAHVQMLLSAFIAELRKDRKKKSSKSDDANDSGPGEDPSWKEQLLDRLMAMPPDGFERLTPRLLREADFDSVKVTGQSGDGGIDGLGVYRMGPVSYT